MIEQGLFKRHFVGRDGFHWWIGQVVSEDAWVINIPGKRTATTEPHKGFDYRYKVRIMGYHTADANSLKDDDLPWASVMFPVTAGSGSGGASQTPNLRQGNFVYGFFIDGEDAQQPVIIGVLGHNQYAAVMKNVPPVPFLPFSGYTQRDIVPRYALPTTQEASKAKQKKPPGKTTKENNKVVVESAVSLDQGRGDGASAQQKAEGVVAEPFPELSTCKPAPLGTIQKKIKNLIAAIQRIRKTAGSWRDKASNYVYNKERQIKKLISQATEFIASGMKWIITFIEKTVLNKINNTLKDTYYLLFPNQRPKLKKGVETVNDLIACLFRKIISNLLKLVGKFLAGAVDRFISTPLACVENMVGSIVGKIAGLLTNIIDSILGPISSLIGQAFDLADGILGVIIDVLSFLSCEEDPDCAETDEWSMWAGTGPKTTIDIESLINKAKNIASTVTDAIDPDNFDFDVDFFGDAGGGCNPDPFPCGVPNVQFFGGGGSGAAGNAILNTVGNLIGVDIKIPGSGYTSAPMVQFADGCGKGSGGSGRVIISTPASNNDAINVLVPQIIPTISTTASPTAGTVTGVVITDPGTGYLPAPDGSRGGNGTTFAEPGDTIVKRSDGTYDPPYKSGDTINLRSGDTVQSCLNPPYIVERDEVIIAPYCQEQVFPTADQYPVVLEIGEVVVYDPGFGYSSEDKVIITPDNGASIDIELDETGSITRIVLKNGGIGFTDLPFIYIESDTGYNGRLIPVLKVVEDLEERDLELFKSQGKVLSVVDCVGKF